YYASEGAEDSVVVELPKGMYVLSFHMRQPGNGKSAHSIVSESAHEAASEAGKVQRSWAGTAGVLVGLLIVAPGVIGGLVAARGPAGKGGAPEAVPAAYDVFWRGFVTGPDEPWVIFSNAAFVGHPDSGLRYYDKKRDANAVIFDHYTGVGEVLAVHNLDSVFATLHQNIRVKRGSLFSLDEANINDLIFIGSPSENLTLLEIPSTRSFVFREVSSGPRKGNVEIVNIRPEAGEGADFLATPANQTLTEDYAIVALTPGLNPAHYQLILAGTTTFGTQAAVEYVTRESSLDDL